MIKTKTERIMGGNGKAKEESKSVVQEKGGEGNKRRSRKGEESLTHRGF